MPFPQTRPRRLRSSESIRRLLRETPPDSGRMIWPAFVVEGEGRREAISSMPGQFHLSIDNLIKEAKVIHEKNVGGILLFGLPDKKDPRATGATEKNSLIGRAVAALKEKIPGLPVATDVCLCGYTDHGHCGILTAGGKVDNDASLELLATMALRHAEAGADIIAPSDMMDGRVGAIRKLLDANRFEATIIMSYSAKYASAFYGPFRDAAHSAPAFGDRRTYQMDPANRREALREIAADVEEGADIVMVKPALPYLDVIAEARRRFNCPIAAYQVSGEYAMIKAAAAKGCMDETAAITESLTAIRRAGADIVISYFAKDWG